MVNSHIFLCHIVCRTFRIWDDNGDRKLNLYELTKGLHDYGLSLAADEIGEMFATLDRDGGGSIDFDELLIALRVRTPTELQYP